MHEFPRWLFETAMRRPERLCFSDGKGEDYTYAEMAECVQGLGAFLQSCGVTPGDRVADVQRNDAFHFATIFALPLIGAVRVPINWRSDARAIEHILEDTDPAVVIHSSDPQVAAVVEGASSGRGFSTIVTDQGGSGGASGVGTLDGRASLRSMMDHGRAVPASVDWDELLSIRYTGGTTGLPKGVLLPSRAELISSLHIVSQSCVMAEFDEVFMHLQPLSHGGGAFVPPAVLRGATNIAPVSFDPDEVVATIMAANVTIVKLVPTMLLRLLSVPQFSAEFCPSVRRIVYGASPMPPEAIRACVARFGPKFVQGYGQTEVPTTISFLPEADHDLDGNPKAARRIESAGTPFATVQVAILVDSGEMSRRPNEVGEILVRSPHQMVGYNNLEEATREKFHDGWIRTGDVGYLDDDGYIYIVDRKSDMIVTGGWNVYPTEVENVVAKHPSVAEVCVFGAPDPDWVEAVHAAVVLRPGEAVEAHELMEFCRQDLSNYKVPKSIQFVASFPLSPAGKVLRRAVREMVGQVVETAQDAGRSSSSNGIVR